MNLFLKVDPIACAAGGPVHLRQPPPQHPLHRGHHIVSVVRRAQNRTACLRVHVLYLLYPVTICQQCLLFVSPVIGNIFIYCNSFRLNKFGFAFKFLLRQFIHTCFYGIQ